MRLQCESAAAFFAILMQEIWLSARILTTGNKMSLQSGKITATHFVWNQDEAAQNSREAKRFCNMSLHSAQTLRPFCGSRHSFAVIFFLTRHSIPIFINLSFDIPCDYHNFIYIKRRTHYVIEYNSRCRAYPHRYLRQA